MDESAADPTNGFYVVPECCITCGIPLDRAPDNFEWASADRVSPCRVKKQPATRRELGAVLEAMQYAEVDCIRYGGDDGDIRRRIEHLGLGDQLDGVSPVRSC